jgi:hypothetical protein
LVVQKRSLHELIDFITLLALLDWVAEAFSKYLPQIQLNRRGTIWLVANLVGLSDQGLYLCQSKRAFWCSHNKRNPVHVSCLSNSFNNLLLCCSSVNATSLLVSGFVLLRENLLFKDLNVLCLAGFILKRVHKDSLLSRFFKKEIPLKGAVENFPVCVGEHTTLRAFHHALLPDTLVDMACGPLIPADTLKCIVLEPTMVDRAVFEDRRVASTEA